MTSHDELNRWRFSLSMFYDHAVAAGNRNMSTWDSLITAWQFRRGSVELAHAGGRLHARTGDWLIIPPGTARRHRFSDDAAIRSVRVAVLDAHGQLPCSRLAPLRLRGDAGLAAAADALACTLPGSAWPRGPVTLVAWSRLQAAVLAWCGQVCDRLGIDGQATAGDARVLAAQRWLLTHRSPAAIAWDGLREATALSRPQLDRLFRQQYGRSVRAWSDEHLLADACTALGNFGDPVKAVAARLGFGDASHFCRWFRKRTGASPADWRRHGGT